MPQTVPVSVVVPTIGRKHQLAACLASLARCRPQAAEIVVVDQSGMDEIEDLVRRFPPAGARVIRSRRRGVAAARNEGLRGADNETVLMTDDDCTVAESWVGIAHGLAVGDPSRIFTGRVLPAGPDSRLVPSTMANEKPRDFTGERTCWALYSGNVVMSRSAVLALGGFDERFDTSEDNDLCYRWLRAGRGLSFEPALTVWHEDWRSHEELERLYVAYWRGKGMLYAKHLRRGDPTMLRFLLADSRDALRASAARLLKGRPRWSDPRRGIFRGLPAGLLAGWHAFSPRRAPRADSVDHDSAPAAQSSRTS
jgi:GT2 family glycosyltransferase